MDIVVDYINWILNTLYSIIFTYVPHQIPISNGQVRYQLYIYIYPIRYLKSHSENQPGIQYLDEF